MQILTFWIHLIQRLLSQYYTDCAKLFFSSKKKKKRIITKLSAEDYAKIMSDRQENGTTKHCILFGRQEFKRLGFSYCHNQKVMT